jgi:hypothetical protein
MKSVSESSKTLRDHRPAEQAILGVYGATPETNRLRQALKPQRMRRPFIIVLGHASCEGPPQYEETGSSPAERTV